MFTSILKLIIKEDEDSAKKAEKNLTKRFTNVAKALGSGLKNALTGGALLAAAEKLLNPFEEIRGVMNDVLQRADDLEVSAKAFETTSGNLLKLQTVGQAFGISPEEINMMLTKFQAAVVNARLNPDDPSAVRQYVGEKDIAEGLFKFLQNAKAAGGTTQTAAVNEVFGTRNGLKVERFVNSADKFGAVIKDLGNPNTEDLTAKVGKGAALQNQRELLGAKNTLYKFDKVVNGSDPDKIAAEAAYDKNKIDIQVQQLQSFSDMAKTAIKVDQLQASVQQLLTNVMTNLPVIMTSLTKAVELLKMASDGWTKIFGLLGNVPMLRGIVKQKGDK